MAGAWPSPVARAETAAARIGIGRMRLVLRHARGRPPPPPDGEALGAAIADALATMLDPGDPAVWVVRSLTVPAHADGAPAAPALARAIALRLREAVARILRGEKSDGAIRYPDRAAWLAALLWDHLRGEARGRWQYARFAALDALPLAYVPRQLFAAEPALALPVMLRLAAAGRLRAFVSAIGESGARGLLPAILAKGHGAASAGQGAALARRLLANAGPALPIASSRAQLVAAVEEAAASGRSPPGRLAAAAAQARAQAVAAGLARRDANRASAGATPPAAPTSSAVLAEAPAAGAKAGPDGRAAPRRQPPPQIGEVIETPYAGIFLLWRSVVELGLEGFWPAEADPGRARLTLAATLAGPERDAAWLDPALHWLAGFAPSPEQGPLVSDPGLATRFAAHMTKRAAPHALRPVIRRRGRLNLVQDRDSEDWLALGGARDLAAFGGAIDPAPPGLRDPAGDLDFFRAGRARDRRAWALVARAAYGDLARRLTGLERSSAWWLWANVVAGWGRLEPGAPARLILPRVPLDLVLRMTGLPGTRITLADGRAFEIALPGPD